MRVAALVSGGKDSCYNMMQCVAEGHEIVALANLHPKDKDELDSYMYQTVGHQGIQKLSEAMGLPLYRRETKGHSLQRGKNYTPTESDEVEDLYDLLKSIKEDLSIEAVAVGAIFSDYQRVRVENVCSRLNLVSLSYLWRRDQKDLLQEMIDCKVHAIIIKVASLGLYPENHLGKSLREIQPHLLKMHEKYGLNVCGEGGEYETFTLDCPLFKQRIIVDDMQIVISSSDPVCPVGYINLTKLHLETKEPPSMPVYVKQSVDYLKDLYETSVTDLSDPECLAENNLELIKNESSKMRLSISRDDLQMQRELSRENSITTNQQTVCFSAESLNLPPVSSDVKDIDFIKNSEIFHNEVNEISNSAKAVVNSRGWMWIAGVQGTGNTSHGSMMDAMAQVQRLMKSHNYKMTDICYITFYVRKIDEYTELNAAYKSVINHTNPPTRICVECPMPPNCHVIVEAVAHRYVEGDNRRHSMHVQGISHWAPANIGPYSQAMSVGDIIYISGQIALVPGIMSILDGGIKEQCKLTLRHLTRIAEAMDVHGHLRNVVQGICFLTHPNYISEARRQWEKRTENAIMDYIIVPELPRKALVEWQVWAHMHNDTFDYEETGCSVEDYIISIRRRWNFENNVAAIVCYASTNTAISRAQPTDTKLDILANHRELARKMTADNLIEILSYTLNKLLKDCAAQNRRRSSTPINASPASSPILPAIHLRIFYQVISDVPVEVLTNTLQEFSERSAATVKLAFTVIPACSLHNFNTFLSICGMRYE